MNNYDEALRFESALFKKMPSRSLAVMALD